MYYSRSFFLMVLSAFFCLSGCTLKGDREEHDESEKDEMQKAMQHEFMMTVDPALGYIPKERLVAAIAYERRLSRMMRMDALNWQERGPGNIAGRTRALMIDSRDNTGNTVIAASVSGGIWRTSNFKASNPAWTPVSENMGSLAVCALAQDPSSPTTMYAGTGEGWFNNDAVRGNGIWKSTDGGSTWNKMASTDSVIGAVRDHNFDFVQDIVVNSQGIVFASTRSVFCNRGGVFRSNNGGSSWTRVIGTPGATCDGSPNLLGTDLEIASNGDVYACTGLDKDPATRGRIFRSAGTLGTNVGTPGNWIDITPAGTWQRIEIAVAPGNAQVVYALLQDGTGDGIGAIKKSTNSGASWSDLPLPSWCNQGATSSDFTNGQAFYDLIAQVDPNNENIVIIGGIDLFKSTNGGTSWTQISQWSRNCGSLPVVHADQHNLLFIQGSSSELISANDGGIYYSSNGGTSWATTTQANLNGANLTTISQKNIGYNITQLYGCDLHPSQTNYFLVGSQDNGSLKLTSSGIAAAVEASLGGDGGTAHIDQTNGNLQLLSYVYNNYYYSRNGGASFSRISFNDDGMFINPSDLDDSRKVLFSSSSAGQLGIVSNLASGTPSFSSFPIAGLGTRKISAVKVDPTVSGGGTVWIAGYDSTRALAPNLIKLTNANINPIATVAGNLLGAIGGSYVSSIDIDPASADHILVTLSNYGIISVYESVNGGTSWTSLDNNSSLPDVPVRWGIFVPADASVNGTTGGGILLATEVGVWFTQTAAGPSTLWTPQNGSLPNVRVDMLRYRPSDNLLAAATHGRGLFTSNLTSLSTNPPPPPAQNFIENVFLDGQQLIIDVGNTNTTTIEIRIFAMDGKLVYSSKSGYANQSISLMNLARGSYILRVFGNNNERYTRQFLK